MLTYLLNFPLYILISTWVAIFFCCCLQEMLFFSESLLHEPSIIVVDTEHVPRTGGSRFRNDPGRHLACIRFQSHYKPNVWMRTTEILIFTTGVLAARAIARGILLPYGESACNNSLLKARREIKILNSGRKRRDSYVERTCSPRCRVPKRNTRI